MKNYFAALRFTASAFLLLSICFGSLVSAQNTAPAPPLPAGMTGSDTSDPRASLSPGLFDAGEAAMGMKHLQLIKKPEAFQLGTDDPNNARVKDALKSIGVSDTSQIPQPLQLVFAQLAFANSDLAFQDNRLFMGNFYGVSIYDISNPADTKLLTTMVCPGGQGDVSVYKNLMFMSVEMPNGRLDCGTQAFPADPPPAAGEEPHPVAQKDRFRGVRIFDISNIKSPKQIGAVQSCRGSHTHTLVVDPKDKKNVYIYVSGTSFVRPGEELAGCSDGTPESNNKISRFSIDVIKVPLDSPQTAKIVASPRIFGDAESGKINALNDGGSHDNKGKPNDTDQCHDITAYSAIGLAAGACAGNGILLDIKDPANPKRVEAVNDPNYAYWHSATFSNDGKKVLYTDEWGGGLGARCRANDPNVWGADAVFDLEGDKLKFLGYYKMPAAQGNSENCVAHNGSLIPVPGRDIKVQAWYQGGISIVDFTDGKKPFEIAYFDRGPLDPNILMLGGYWSSYWYNGHIYSSEIARGLDVFELTPTKDLTQNEIDAAKSIRVAELNVQNQQMIVFPKTLIVAKAYLDQLERTGGISSGDLSDMRAAIDKASDSAKDKGKLKKFSSKLKKAAKTAKDPADSKRLTALAEIMKKPQ
ncbi:MAG: hypothetical protein R2684_08495 [Pyrinomonadaceae bacterium]